MEGLVIRTTGSSFLVKLQDNTTLECLIKGNFRIKGLRSTNPVVVGDRVLIEHRPGDKSYITEIKDRKNYIVRKPTNLSKQLHILAANIDQAFLIVSLNRPTTHTTFIDRFLATAEAYRIPAQIVINKSDLHDEEDQSYAKDFMYLYESIGYPCSMVSAQTGQGVEALAQRMSGKINLFSGNSGVGKSTLINAIDPNVHARTGAISDAHQKGMHTTTSSEMFELNVGGYLIDTPGIKGFGTIDMQLEEVGHYFPEIFKTSEQCRFNNCTHTREPGCAVLEAVGRHLISASRYASYISILEDCQESSKYR
ncbi:MAG: ribosome small subunit-dependent GTPase A [Bacteroidales bacterium]